MATGNDRKGQRRPNFSRQEIQTLVEKVVENHELLFGKFSASLSSECKERKWRDICKAVNAVLTPPTETLSPRTVREIKKKYQSLKSEVKSRLAKKNASSINSKMGRGRDETIIGLSSTQEMRSSTIIPSALQHRQANLLEKQVEVLGKIAGLIEERNKIEVEKLGLKKARFCN